MATPRQSPYVWTTWSTRRLAGAAQCAWAATLRAEGYSVFVEGQNAFKLRGQQDIILTGTPDIIALNQNTAAVIECKTGLPRNAGQLQVIVYLLILPYVRPAWKHKLWQGSVHYQDTVVENPDTVLDTQCRALFRLCMEQLCHPTLPTVSFLRVTSKRRSNPQAGSVPARLVARMHL
jgi:hypothetical protein